MLNATTPGGHRHRRGRRRSAGREPRADASSAFSPWPTASSAACKALIQSAGLAGKGVDSTAIGFRLAPVLNAAGRMGHARLAVELLTSTSEMRAMQIAEYLKDQNTQRQQCERKMLKQACDIVVERGLNHPDRRSIVLGRPGLAHGRAGHRGVAAGRPVLPPGDHDQRVAERGRLGPGLGPVDPGIQYARRDRGVRVAPDELRGPQDGGGSDDAAGEDRGVRGGLRDLRGGQSPAGGRGRQDAHRRAGPAAAVHAGRRPPARPARAPSAKETRNPSSRRRASDWPRPPAGAARRTSIFSS